MNKVFEVFGNSVEDLQRRVGSLLMVLRAQGSCMITVQANERGRSARVYCRPMT